MSLKQMTLSKMQDCSAGYDIHSRWWRLFRMLKRPNNTHVAKTVLKHGKTAFDIPSRILDLRYSTSVLECKRWSSRAGQSDQKIPFKLLVTSETSRLRTSGSNKRSYQKLIKVKQVHEQENGYQRSRRARAIICRFVVDCVVEGRQT